MRERCSWQLLYKAYTVALSSVYNIYDNGLFLFELTPYITLSNAIFLFPIFFFLSILILDTHLIFFLPFLFSLPQCLQSKLQNTIRKVEHHFKRGKKKERRKENKKKFQRVYIFCKHTHSHNFSAQNITSRGLQFNNTGGSNLFVNAS